MIRQTQQDALIVNEKHKHNLQLLAALRQGPSNLYWKDGLLETEIYVLFKRKAVEQL